MICADPVWLVPAALGCVSVGWLAGLVYMLRRARHVNLLRRLQGNRRG